jgi:capsular exopolysaccharide synthesis family protein
VSKLFEDAKKSQWTNAPIRVQDVQQLDVGQLLESIEYPEIIKEAIPEPPVERSRTASLVRGDSPVTVAGETPSTAALESYRALRTRLLNRQAAKAFNSIMITSAAPREGKTLTSLNLALCFSQLPDTRVLLVDADLRSRGLSHFFGNPETAGVMEVLSGAVTPEDAVQATEHKNLFVVTAGASIGESSSAEQFAGPRWREFMAWSSEAYSLVLVDSPPDLAVADSQMIAAGCDALLVVVRALQTSREMLQRLAGSIDKSKLIGVVYNAMPGGIMSRLHYGYGYGYGNGNKGKR